MAHNKIRRQVNEAIDRTDAAFHGLCDTLAKIEGAGFECEGGPLGNFVPWGELKDQVEKVLSQNREMLVRALTTLGGPVAEWRPEVVTPAVPEQAPDAPTMEDIDPTLAVHDLDLARAESEGMVIGG